MMVDPVGLDGEGDRQGPRLLKKQMGIGKGAAGSGGGRLAGVGEAVDFFYKPLELFRCIDKILGLGFWKPEGDGLKFRRV